MIPKKKWSIILSEEKWVITDRKPKKKIPYKKRINLRKFVSIAFTHNAIIDNKTKTKLSPLSNLGIPIWSDSAGDKTIKPSTINNRYFGISSNFIFIIK